LGTEPQYADRLRRMVNMLNPESASWRWETWARELLANLPMDRAAGLIRARLGRSPAPGERSIPTATSAPPVPTEERVQRWITNTGMVQAAAERFGVHALFVWQPAPTYHYDLNYHLFANHLLQWGSPGPLVADQSKAVYSLLDERRRDPDVERNLLWLGDLQLARQENLYVDSLHYTGAFSRDIAVAIADDMGRRGWTSCPARPRG
jgi:hypothetical protein